MNTDLRTNASRLTSVCVIIPTFRRPKGLATAMASIATQVAQNLRLDMIVCDNSPEASARSQVEAFALTAAFPVRFVHEPATGVANARNTAVAACTSDFIAFLDDDEDAPTEWLGRLTQVQAQFDADVVFGPVDARLPDDISDALYDGYLHSFFSRCGPDNSQLLDSYYGCGNSLIRRSVLPEVPFNVQHNEMGGEDDQLFYGLMTAGNSLAWAADAPVFEDVPAGRARLSYTLRRAFAYGQGPSYTAAVRGKPLACARWMIQGAGQCVVFGIWGGALRLIGSPKAAARLDKAARGFGKLIWFPPFKIGFYGQALLKPNAPAR